MLRQEVYVPYMFLTFDYRLVRSSKKNGTNKLRPFDREGQIGVVFDMNEVHAFHSEVWSSKRRRGY